MPASSLVDVRPGERTLAAAGFLTLLGTIAGHTLLETARDALFLSRLPASQLPWAYLAIAGLALVLARSSAVRRLGGRRALSATLAVAGLGTLGFAALGSAVTDSWAVRSLYVWSGVVGTLAPVQIWLVLGELFTIGQARRLFRLVGLGSVTGALLGAALAWEVSLRWPASRLVPLAGLLLLATGLGPALLLRRPVPVDRRPRRVPIRPGVSTLDQALSLVRDQPYLMRLTGLVFISSLALTLGDYVFKNAVARSVPPDQLPVFFASLNTALGALSLLFQLFVMGWLLRAAGLHRALWILPALVGLGATGLAFGGGIAAAVLLKGADGSLRHSLHRTSLELLYLPIPDALRSRTKPFIDAVGQRGGQALAAVVLLSEVAQGRGDVVIAGAAAVSCAVWIGWAVDLRHHYLELFRRALREGRVEPTAELPPLDLGSLEALFAALNSRDDTEVVAALELLASEGRARLIPALVLYHPSPAVVLRALDLFAASGRTDFVPVAERLLGHPDPRVRAEALRARQAVIPDLDGLRRALGDSSPEVRATAVVGLIAAGEGQAAESTLQALLESPEPGGRRALARAIERRPHPAFARVLRELSYFPSAEVRASAARAMGELADESFLPSLLPLLASYRTRGPARGAFVRHGESGLRFLGEALADVSLPREIRRHVPRTLTAFPAAQAAAVLVPRLLDEPHGLIRFKVLRALGRLVGREPEVTLDTVVLATATARTLSSALRVVDWRDSLERGVLEVPARATPGHDLLAALMRDKEADALERLFRLLALRHRDEDFEKIHRGLRSLDPKVRSGSRELLENVLAPPVREAVLSLTDDGPPAVRLAGAGPFHRRESLAYETLLARLLEETGETVRSLAAYHVAELGLRTMRPRLVELRSEETGLFVARVLEKAARVLGDGREGALAV